MNVKVGGIEVDLTRALPFTSGDFRKLSRGGLDFVQIMTRSARSGVPGSDEFRLELDLTTEQAFTAAVVALQKASGGKITAADVEAMPLVDMLNVATFVIARAFASEERIDPPTSAPSTSSGAPTDGDRSS